MSEDAANSTDSSADRELLGPVECVCGALIQGESDGDDVYWWHVRSGNDYCYPDANDDSRFVTAEPFDA